MPYENILRRLQDRELILPYFELKMLADKWPDNYQIEIDSSEYYGKGDGYFHPSTHALMGARELYYRFHPDTCDKIIPERRTLKRQMILAMGSALHGILQTQMEMAGLVRPEKIEVEYVIPEHHVRGRIDWIVDHPTQGELLVEMKTRDPWIYKRDEIVPAEDAQLSLGEYAQGKTEGILLVVERGGAFQMKELFHRRNDELLAEIFDKFDYVRQCIADNTPPRHCCTYGSPAMNSCSARFQCWLAE